MTEAASRLLAAARAAGLKIATAESCTGGMIGAALTDVAGSSDVFERGFITYSNLAKQEMLGVSSETLKANGAVSEDVAREMAEGALRASPADIAIAVTGVAGPGGSEHKPEGRVCFGLARRDGQTVTETVEFGPIGRANVRSESTLHGIRLVNRAINGAKD